MLRTENIAKGLILLITRYSNIASRRFPGAFRERPNPVEFVGKEKSEGCRLED